MASVTDLLSSPVTADHESPGASTSPRAMIVADDAYVTYRVYASGKRVSARESLLRPSAFRGGRDLKEIPALRGVTFTASEGETIGVVGHNGSGKSTLFRAMSGLIPTSSGTIAARDRPVLLGVNAALVPELSGENNIRLGLLAMGFSAEEAAARVGEIADFAELNEFIHHPMKTYSSGMGARLRFAIASAKAHSILLIDEALAVGDRRFKLKSEQRIRELQDSAGLVMIVSHSVGSLKDTCERVLWIHKGELRADGPSGDVVDEYVQWTKHPNSAAVGAAVGAKKPDPSPVAAERPVASDTPAGAGPSPIEQLLAAAAASADAREAELNHERSHAPHRANGAAVTESARTVARRERYRRTAQERRRRRILALVITSASILIAAGAGAAVAILATLPENSDGVSPRALAAPPQIASFTASAPTAACTTASGTADITLNWSADDAVWVALASGAAKVDAIDKPLASGLAETGDAYKVAFPCTEQARVYTLTVAGGEGTRVSSTVTVARELAPTPTPTPEEQTDIDSDSDSGSGGYIDPGTGGGGTAEQTAPPAEPEPTQPVEPENPDPVPTVPEAPAPVEPTPVDPTPEVPAEGNSTPSG